MNARLESVGHGDGKVYLQMVLDRLHDDASVLLDARLKDGTKVPAHLFPFTPLERSSQANHVVVVPHLEAREIDLTFVEQAHAAPISQSRLTVELGMVRWRTRFNALVHREMFVQMLDIEREYRADRMSVRFVDAIPDGDELVVKMLVDMPQRDGSDVMVDFTDLAGKEIDLPVYPLRDEVHPAKRLGDDARLVLGFSVRVQAQAKEFCVTVYDAHELVAGGFAVFCDETLEPIEERRGVEAVDAGHDVGYGAWYERHCETLAGLALQRRASLPVRPLVSLVVPAFAGDECYLAACLRAIRQQTYPHFETLLVDGGLNTAFLDAVLAEWEGDARLVHVAFSGEDEGAARCVGLLQSSGDACAVVDPSVIFAPEALFEYVRRVAECAALDSGAFEGVGACDVAYANHDAYSRQRGFCSPVLKPAYSPELLCSCEYLGPVTFFSRRVIDDIAGAEGFASEGFSHDVVLKAVARAERVERIDRVLYHVQDAAGISEEAERVRVGREEAAFRGGRKAVANHLRRMGVDATALAEVAERRYRVRYRLPDEPPSLSIVLLPGAAGVAEACLDSLGAADGLGPFGVLVVDAGEGDAVLAHARERFGASRVTAVSCAPTASRAAMANAAVRGCDSAFVLLLDADSEFVDEEGLASLLAHALRPGVGVVGPKLLFPDDTVRAAGMAVGGRGLAVPLGQGLPRSSRGYGGRLACSRNASAVSGEAMMLSREAFDAAGGFDERFAVAGWDVDFCLKAIKAGFEVVFDGAVELYCQAPPSMPDEALPASARLRLERERAFFRYRWPRYFVEGDPCMSACLDADSPCWRLAH